MQQILVYSDSLSWGIVPNTRKRLAFAERWPGAMEDHLIRSGRRVRVIEDCLNGRRTVWEDPFKSGRNGLIGLQQRIEVSSPLALVVLMLGTNDFQSMHHLNAWHSSQGVATLVRAIRSAPIEPGMPVPEILIVAPPPARTPQGAMAPKFDGADAKSKGLAEALAEVAKELGCPFYDAGRVVTVSAIDGVHLDADQHLVLAHVLAKEVATSLDAAARSGGSHAGA
jgi:lysophospholipase L1-like esterase